jgi:acid phosphatase type 7
MVGKRTRALFIAILVIALLAFAAAQAQEQSPAPTPSPQSDQPAPVGITNGPVVESVTDTTAIIAWSTNVNAGTSLRYGTDPSHLDKTAGMPWGGFTHRVYLTNLQPGTKYFFQAESGKAQGTGTTATADVMSFQTKAPADTSTRLDQQCTHE